MSMQAAQRYLQEALVRMHPTAEVRACLRPATYDFLCTVGLPNSDELGFDFTGRMTLRPTGLVVFEQASPGRLPCLDVAQQELLRWEDDAAEGFINSSAEQFVECVYAYESYLRTVQAPEKFGPFYDSSGNTANRVDYADYLQQRFEAIDPAVLHRGYYWPAFLERIEFGL